MGLMLLAMYMPPRPVILDTNLLLLPFQFKINILKELAYLIESSHYYLISSNTLGELEKLGKITGKNGMAARLALKMIKNNNIKVVRSDMNVDDWIVNYARDNNAVVCTNDAALRKRLKSFGIKMIAMKSRSKLGFV